jgi:hypothetical protein
VSIKPRALRLIDLASYFLTITAFGSAVFGLKHYDNRWRSVWDRLEIRDAIADTDFDGCDRPISKRVLMPDIHHSS